MVNRFWYGLGRLMQILGLFGALGTIIYYREASPWASSLLFADFIFCMMGVVMETWGITEAPKP